MSFENHLFSFIILLSLFLFLSLFLVVWSPKPRPNLSIASQNLLTLASFSHVSLWKTFTITQNRLQQHMVRRKEPTVMGKLLNFLTGTTKAHKRRDIEEEKLRHAGKAAEFLSRKDIENQRIRHTRPNPEKQAAQDEALRKLNGHREPARRQPPPVRTDKPLPVERTRPEPAHTRRKKVRTDDRDDPRPRRDRSDHRQKDPRSRPQPEPQRRQEAPAVPQFIAPSFGSSVHSSHMQSLDSRGGEPHVIKGPNRKPEITSKVPDIANSAHKAEVFSRASTRRNDRPARGSDRTTQFGDFMRPVSPLLPPPVPSPPNAGTSQQGRQAPGRDNSIPFCQMCETRPSSLDGCYSVLGYHLCAVCRRTAFSDDGPQDSGSPVSPLSPEQTPDARLQEFDFANTAKRGHVTRASSRSTSNTTKAKANFRNLTGHPAPLHRAPSSGLNPALHKSASKTQRRQPTYSTIFNDRSQAQPAPPMPALPPRAHPIPAAPLRHKTSSVYSLSDTLPPSMLPPANIAPSSRILPPIAQPQSRSHSPKKGKGEGKPSARLSRPFEEPPQPKTHRLSRPFEEPAALPQAHSHFHSHFKDKDKDRANPKANPKAKYAHLRISPPASPGATTSAWTEDWSGYGASTVAEARGVRVPPMPVVKEWNGEEDGEKRDTKFYGHWDEIVGYKSKGPGGRRRYNGL